MTQYDDLGNIRFRSAVGTYTYDSSGRLEGVDSKAFQVDGRGNVVRRELGGQTTDVVYTAFDKPLSITVTGSGEEEEEELEFEYTADGSRVLRRATNAETETFYMGGLYELEIEGDPESDATYRYRFSVHNGERVVAVVERTEDALGDDEWATRYLLANQLGSTDVVLDEAGAVLERRAYSAWGERRKADAWWEENEAPNTPLVLK